LKHCIIFIIVSVIVTAFGSLGSGQVAVKFIRKSKVATESWVETESHRCLPREVSLLLKLHHPNIVKVSILSSWFQIVIFCRLPA